MATNKDSFNQLIARVKHDNPQEISVRHNILNKENSDISHNDRITKNDSIIKDNQKTDFLSLNVINYTEDSDSNTSCPLPTYSRENPMDFLAIELNSSSNDSNDQYVSNDISNHLYKTNPDSFNFIVKGENTKMEKLSSESILIHEETTVNTQSRQCVSQNEMDMDVKRNTPECSKIETENGEQAKLFKRSKSDTKYSLDKCVAYSESKNRWQKELRNEDIDSIIEDTEPFVDDSDNIDVQDDYGK